MSPQSSDLRRKILSYRYEVEQLVADYIRLERASANYAEQQASAPNPERELLRRIVESKSWRYTRWFRTLMARLRRDRGYRDEHELVESLSARRPAGLAMPRREDFPRLPTLPELGYREKPLCAQKSWDTATFLNTFYYDHIPLILDRPETKGRPIFVQMTTIDWFVPLYQRPQHMALAMARQGYVVFYMTGNGQFDKAFGFHEVEPNVFITNQPVPLMLEDALVSFYSTSPVMEYWIEEFGEEFRKRRHKLVYEYIDHIDPEISFEYTDTLVRQYKRLNRELIQLGVASARALEQELADKVPGLPIAYVPNGVDVEHYQLALADDHRDTIPPAMRDVVAAGRPVVGYFGALAPWLWYEVINELAALRPDLSFVFIGPDYLGAHSRLEERENVFKLGSIDYSLLPYFAQHFDVALVPFKPGDIARTTSPLKLFEYFALGLPVVVTDGMDECTAYDVVLAAASAADYSRRIDEALALGRDPEFAAKAKELAGQNSWNERAKVLAAAAKEAGA